MFRRPAVRADFSAFSSIGEERSTPRANPFGPTICASSIVTSPKPQPISKACSPPFGAAFFDQPPGKGRAFRPYRVPVGEIVGDAGFIPESYLLGVRVFWFERAP